jgi:hypothetical protein
MLNPLSNGLERLKKCMAAPYRLKGWTDTLNSIAKTIDYMFVSEKDKHGLVYFVESPKGVMCGGTSSDSVNINALMICDTPEEATALATEQGIDGFKIITTTLFTLCDDWRFFIYRDSCRMIVAGDGWLSRAVGEMPKYGSHLTSDPSCSVICGRDADGKLFTRDGGIIIAQDLSDALEDIDLPEGISQDEVEFIVRPLILFAVNDESVWFQGTTYNVREALARNSYMLSNFIDVDEEAAMINRLKVTPNEN